MGKKFLNAQPFVFFIELIKFDCTKMNFFELIKNSKGNLIIQNRIIIHGTAVTNFIYTNTHNIIYIVENLCKHFSLMQRRLGIYFNFFFT